MHLTDRFLLKACGILISTSSLYASGTISVNSNYGGYSDTEETLITALWQVNSTDVTIDCSAISGQTISLLQPLPALVWDGTIIDGYNITIDGGSIYPGFTIAAGTSSSPNYLLDINLQNVVSQGGNGAWGESEGSGGQGGGGGGGTGGGGAVYVGDGAYVTLNVVNMTNCQAIGGSCVINSGYNGNAGGGGGGFGGGDGGITNDTPGSATIGAGSGGGGHAGGGNALGDLNATPYTYGGAAGGIPSTGSSQSPGNGGTAIDYTNKTQAYSGGSGYSSSGGAGGGAGIGSIGGNGSASGGGNGGYGFNGSSSTVGGGGGGGVGYSTGGNPPSSSAGNGSGAGGGGGHGSGYNNGGAGGPNGGGGGGANTAGSTYTGIGGEGGFGAGGGGPSGAGGGLYPINIAPGTTLGGSGGEAEYPNPAQGGGGSGLGGAIFIQSGGVLQITDSASGTGATFSNNSVQGGTGYVNGAALGENIFIQTGGNLIINNNYMPITLSGVSGDGATYTGLTLQKEGSQELYFTLDDSPTQASYTNYGGYTQLIDGTVKPLVANALSPNCYYYFSKSSSGTLYDPVLFIEYDNTIGGVSSQSGDDIGGLTVYADGTSTTLNINLINGASYTYGGLLDADSASGGLTYLNVSGEGTQKFTQISGTFTKVTVSDGATLYIDGTLQSTDDPLVQNGGRLGGSGTVNDTTIEEYSTIVGGDYTVPGPLHIDGNLTLNPQSLMDLAETPSGFSSILVSHNATINEATLNLVVNHPSSLLIDAPIEFLTVDSTVSGSGFTEITSNLFYVSGSITEEDGSFLLTPSFKPFASFVQNNKNAEAVGNAINKILASKDQAFAPVIDSFASFTSGNDMQKALNAMQSSLFKAAVVSEENNSVRVRESINYRMQDFLDRISCGSYNDKKEKESPCKTQEKAFHLWIDGFGDYLYQDQTRFWASPQIGYQTNTGGVVLGLEGRFQDYFHVGAIGAYTGSSVLFDQDLGQEGIDTGYAGLYFSFLGKMFYANLSIIGNWSHLQGSREIIYPGTYLTANNSHGSTGLLSHIDTGINLRWKNFTFRPFDSFDYITQTENGYKETGAEGWNLKVQSSNAILLRNELGAQVSGCFCFGTTQLTLSPKISWVREVRPHGASYTEAFENTPYSFTVHGYFPDRSLVSPGIEISTSFFEDLFVIDGYYNAEVASGYNDQAFGGQVRFGF